MLYYNKNCKLFSGRHHIKKDKGKRKKEKVLKTKDKRQKTKVCPEWNEGIKFGKWMSLV